MNHMHYAERNLNKPVYTTVEPWYPWVCGSKETSTEENPMHRTHRVQHHNVGQLDSFFSSCHPTKDMPPFN
jgi:hypothetical protein